MRRIALRLMRPTVLRVDRYAIKNPPADAARDACVLGMVVEPDASGK